MDFLRLVIKVPRVIPNENPKTNNNKFGRQHDFETPLAPEDSPLKQAAGTIHSTLVLYTVHFRVFSKKTRPYFLNLKYKRT